MRNKFNKQLTKEFNQSFKPTFDKELLKEELNIKPKEIKCYSFKKKQFIAFTLSCVLLIVAITSITTWAITKNQMFNNNGTNEQTEDVDVVKMFEEKYPDNAVRMIMSSEIDSLFHVSIIQIYDFNNDSNDTLFILYFQNIQSNKVEQILYDLSINNDKLVGEIKKSNGIIQCSVKKAQCYVVNIKIKNHNSILFEFCTSI